MNRRTFSFTALAAAAFGATRTVAADGPYEVVRSEAEWRAMLSNAQYNVMREEGTERAGSSPLDKNYADGVYHCRGCDQALYSSAHKYDSGTGWPSFFDVLPSAIQTKEDRRLLSVRTECHCDRCGSHLGHIFNDGPAPTGLRHCLNGVSLVFRAA
ncbi:MAG: peptide-methionine (R)-S-oxide reductase MsrB [Octadecabacter sp.]